MPGHLRTAFLISVVLFLLAGCTSLREATSPPPDNLQLTKNPGAAAIRYAVFPAPPFMIGAGEDQRAISGIDVDIVQEIARRMGMNIDYVKCTWARCLELMKSGEVDLLSSAYKKPDREEYMIYFERPYLRQLPIAFYFPKNKPQKIENYEDLYWLKNVGVLSGASYFERFDKDPRINKFEVPSQDQLFPMLVAGRLDVVAGYVPTENYRISTEGYRGVISRSEYEYQEQALVFMTVSKKSLFSSKIVEMNQINQALFEEGFITKLITAYYEKYQ